MVSSNRALLLAVLLAAVLAAVLAVPTTLRQGETEAAAGAADRGGGVKEYAHRAWVWIKRAARKVKGWAVGEHSLYNQMMSKLKENRTISVLGKKVTFTLPDASSSSSSSSSSGEGSSSVHWGHSASSIMHNLKREPVLRVLLALYINIVIFMAVYGYLLARHIMLSINLKKAAQPEKERERRRQKERRKEVKRRAKEARNGGGGGGGDGFRNPSLASPPESSRGGHDSLRSTDFEEEIGMDRFNNDGVADAAAAAARSTPTQ